MSLPIYLDHNVSAAVADGLRRRNIDVLTALADHASESEDEEILERATSLGRILFTHDDDFLSIGAQWLASGQHFSGIVYTHQTRLAAAKIIDDLQLIAETLSAEEFRDRILYVPL